MNQVARRIGRTIALVLPVTMVLSGTLAVTRVPWAPSPAESQLLTASTTRHHSPAADPQAAPPRRSAEQTLTDQLLTTLRRDNPGVALDQLHRAVLRDPRLAPHCGTIAARLGRAATAQYGPTRARSYARPVCDTSYLDAATTS